MNWFSLIQQLLPFVAMQLYFFCLVYLLISRARFKESFAFLAFFLGAMIFFLGCYLTGHILELHYVQIIQVRMGVLFSLGFPSLVVASFKLYQIYVSRAKIFLLYGSGVMLSCFYVFFLSLGWRSVFGAHHLYFSDYFPGFHDGFLWSKMIAIMTTVGLVIVPCGWLLIFCKQTNLKSKAFVFSSILFSVLFVVGLFTKQWWIYYVGSILSAGVFVGAVYLDIYHLNLTSSFIKEALKKQVLDGKRTSENRVFNLIEKLEISAQSNLEVYKMRVREVLGMIADGAIEAGGDVDVLLKKNQESLSKIESASDLESVSQVTKDEAQELTEIIIDLPNQRRMQVMEQVKEYISKNLEGDLKVSTLTEVFCVSKSYLTNGFKEVEGVTLNQYITNVRI